MRPATLSRNPDPPRRLGVGGWVLVCGAGLGMGVPVVVAGWLLFVRAGEIPRSAWVTGLLLAVLAGGSVGLVGRLLRGNWGAGGDGSAATIVTGTGGRAVLKALVLWIVLLFAIFMAALSGAALD